MTINWGSHPKFSFSRLGFFSQRLAASAGFSLVCESNLFIRAFNMKEKTDRLFFGARRIFVENLNGVGEQKPVRLER